MQWIAPSEKDVATDTLEKRLWAAADQLRSDSGLTSAQYSPPVLGLIFLPFAEVRFARSVLSWKSRRHRPGVVKHTLLAPKEASSQIRHR
jgi:hypothetical protein